MAQKAKESTAPNTRAPLEPPTPHGRERVNNKSFNDQFRRIVARPAPEPEPEPDDQQPAPPPRRRVRGIDAGAGTFGPTKEVEGSINDAIRKAIRGF